MMAPEPAAPLEAMLAALCGLPATARRAALGPMLDALDEPGETRLAQAALSAREAGDQSLPLAELCDELAARQAALKSSPATHRELLDGLCKAFPHRSEHELAFAAMLLPADLQSRVLKSHASVTRGLFATDSTHAMAETIARLAQQPGGDSPLSPLALHVELLLAELPELQREHALALRFLEKQGEKSLSQPTRLSDLPPTFKPQNLQQVMHAAGLPLEASGSDLNDARHLNQALDDLCRDHSARLAGSPAHSMLHEARQALDSCLSAQGVLQNHCEALGLDRPTELPLALIAATTLDVADRKKTLRGLMREMAADTQSLLSKRLLDRNLKPTASVKTLLAKLRVSESTAETALANVVDSVCQMLATSARAPQKSTGPSDDELIANAIKEAQSDQQPTSQSSAPQSRTNNPNRQKLRAALRAENKIPADRNNLALARAEARLRDKMAQRPANPHARPDTPFAQALRAIESNEQNPATNNPLEKHIASLSEHDIVRLLANAEELRLSMDEEGATQRFRREALTPEYIFKTTETLARMAHPTITVDTGRQWLAQSLEIQAGRKPGSRQPTKNDATLIDTLLVCVPCGAWWGRAIGQHNQQADLQRTGLVEQEHVDWGAGFEAYRIIEQQLGTIPGLGEDILLTWMDITQRYLKKIGGQAGAPMTQKTARLLEEIAGEQAAILATALGDKLHLVGEFAVNASMTYAATLSREKAQSSTMASPATFAAWVLLDSLLHSEVPARAFLQDTTKHQDDPHKTSDPIASRTT